MPRLPSLKKAKEVAKRDIHMLGLEAFPDREEKHYGLSGSPTQVERIFPPEQDQTHEIWEEAGASARLYEQLKKWKFV